MLPAALGVAAFQINVVLTQGLAYWIEDYIVASFQYAVRLMELPQGLFGVSLATYLLPALSGFAAEKNYVSFRSELRQGLSYLIFANLIASVLLVVLAEPIIRLLFERGQFNALSTQQASLALMCLAPGLVAFSMVNVLARAFFALSDTKTPMKISICCLILNLVLAIALVFRLKQAGLGIANTATSLINVWLLTFALKKKLTKLELQPFQKELLPLGIAAILAGCVAWFGMSLWEDSLGHRNLLLKLGHVFVPAALAAVVYWIIALVFKVSSAREFFELLRKRFRRTR
jgi:putative peptidoglycan lipid II flippase